MTSQQGCAALTVPQRFLQVDAFRALALFGLFIVHCVELFELHWADPKPSFWFDTTFLVFGGKAFAMFALSFGLSFSIIMNRAALRNEPGEGRFLWRCLILMLIGVLHTAIYRGDILMKLGLLGLLLVPFNRIKSNAVLFGFALLFLINVPLIVRILLNYAGVNNGFQLFVDANTVSMQAYMTGGLYDFFVSNLGAGSVTAWLYMFESGRLSQIMGLFLLGLILGRLNVFTDLARYQVCRWVTVLISGGLGLTLYQYQTELSAWFPASAAIGANFYVSSLVGGWANLFIMFFQTAIFFELWFLVKGNVLTWVAPLGQMSLTLYVGQSIVFVPLLYNVGLGLFDNVTAGQMFWVGILCFILQGIFAAAWLQRFNYGPLEWLWRALTQRSCDIPFRRKIS